MFFFSLRPLIIKQDVVNMTLYGQASFALLLNLFLTIYITTHIVILNL